MVRTVRMARFRPVRNDERAVRCCGVLASAACMDKHYTKVLLAAAGIPVAPGITLDVRDYDAASEFATEADEMLAAVQQAGLQYRCS